MAETDDCCAWERGKELMRWNISEFDESTGSRIFCGFPDSDGSFGTERHWCCKGVPKDCLSKTQSLEGMSGENLRATGPATKAVHEFAADEDLWLREFTD